MEMRYKNENKAVGRIVMVHPDLTTDPVDRQGQIGRVASIDDRETVIVSFTDGVNGKYDRTGLLTLLPRQVIIQGILSNINEQPAQDQRCLLNIRRLVNQNKYAKALQVAMSNDSAKFFCTTSLDKWVEMQSQKKPEHKQKVVGYVRSAVVNNPNTVQEENITKYCVDKQLDLVKVFYDIGASGLDVNRRGWLELKSFIATNNEKIKEVVVDSLDRIGRDMAYVINEVNSLRTAFNVEVASTQPMEEGVAKLLAEKIKDDRSARIKMGIYHSNQRKKGKSL